MKPSWWTRILSCFSQLINVVIFNGHEDEMVSSRSHREKWQLEWWLDLVFGAGHCKESYEWELIRRDCR